MHRRFWKPFLFGLLLLALPMPAAAAVPAARHDMLVLRSGSGSAAAMLVVPARGGSAMRLPSGLYNSKTHVVYVVRPADAGHSVLRAIDANTGRTSYSLTLTGRYSSLASDYSAATLSFNGRWLALRATLNDAHHTAIVVIDTQKRSLAVRIRLSGHFGLDALDPNGRYLYLIESLPQHGQEAYQVRSYSLVDAALDAQPVFEKGEAVGTMSGVAHNRVWSPNGGWLFTLYVRPGNGGAFIHALDVNDRIAHCIDLPDKGVAGQVLAQYSLAIAPNGGALYAANPATGRILVLRRSASAPDLAFGTVSSVQLSKHVASTQPNMNGSAVSRDGRQLFLATPSGVWVIDTGTPAVRTVYLDGNPITSLALSRDGSRLYALEPGKAVIQALDATTGKQLGSISTGAWAIEQVMH